MDITTAFKLHKKVFGAEETYKTISEIDQVFIDKGAHEIRGRGHAPREMLGISNRRLIREIAMNSDCSDRILRFSGANSAAWFFPWGFKDALSAALTKKIRSSLHIPALRDCVFSADLGV